MMISIVMPVYKTEYSILKRAVDSICNQTYSDWELNLVDDNDGGTTYFEDVKKIAQELAENLQIHVVQDGRNKGANVARNIGLQMAKGDIIAFCDSDDRWMPGYLDFVAQYFKEHKDVVLLSSSYKIIWRGNRSQSMIQHPRLENIAQKELYRDLMSPTTCVAARKSVLLQAGGFDATLEARQDYDMWLRACRYGNVGFSDFIAADLYRDGDGHESISQNYKRHISATERVLEKILERNDLSLEEQRQIKAKHYRYMAIAAIKNKDCFLARKYVKKMQENDRSKKAWIVGVLCDHYYLFKMAQWAKIHVTDRWSRMI